MNSADSPPLEVIKIGGVESEDESFLAALAQELRERDLGANPCVLVHGGGRRVSSLCESQGLPVRFVSGLRVTPPAVVDLVDMVLGAVGSRVARFLVREGVQAVSLRGADGLLRASLHARAEELGRVGEPAVGGVDVALLRTLVSVGRIPVVSPVAVDNQGQLLNVNADHAAVVVALALGSTCLSFVSGVPGVLSDGRLLPILTRADAEALVKNGVIRDGMIPKVESALRARAGGVAQVRIRGATVGMPSLALGTRIV
jgi:acetylglutamate kinase